MKKKKILFLCTGNSCRSQIAEGIANKLLSKDIITKSAGTESHGLSQNAIKVMDDISIPISHHKSKKINFEDLNSFDIVITLCGDAKDRCPYFKSKTKHIHWNIEDPAVFAGTKKDIYIKYAEVRDDIFKKINNFKTKLRSI